MMNKFILLLLIVFAQTIPSIAKEVILTVTNNLTSHNEAELVFSDVHEAVKQAYVLKQKNVATSIVISIEEGEYYLRESIKIDAQLSGLTIKAKQGDKVTLKGSAPLKLKWKKHKKGVYVAKIEEDIDFDQLIINGQPQILARYPNYNEEGGYWQGHAKDAISAERISTWKNPKGAIFHAMHGGKWGGFHYLIEGVDQNGQAILSGGKQNNRPSKPHEELRMVENVLEELDSPHEWYLDKEDKKLYFYPSKEIDLSKVVAEGVVLKELIRIEGTENQIVEDVSIQGIKLEHTKRTLFEEYEQLLRSDWSIYRGGAIYLSNANNCAIQNCELTNLGGNVIFVSGRNQNHLISGNHIYNCGASAISFVGKSSAVRSPSYTYREYVKLSDMDKVWGPQSNDYPTNCVADDNLIYRIGRIEKQTAGVQIAMAMNITVSHNSIYEVPRAGINIGDGTWGGHVLECNDVFDTVLETGDHGSFNSWGRDRFWHPNRKEMNKLVENDVTMPYWDACNTTVIRNNRFRCDHGWDIDLDDGSTNYHIYNNLCLNGGIKLREGFGRRVENNIMVNNSLHPHVWFKASEDVFKRNIVQDSYKDVGVEEWGREMDYNLFPFEESLMKAQVYGIEKHSVYGNPAFKNPEALDFSVKENSKALEIGFVNFSMTAFGVKSPALKAMAKTPKAPVLTEKRVSSTESPTVEWLRAKLKNIESKEEQSAYGLENDNGVVVLNIGAHSLVGKSGMKKRDVILEVEGTRVADLKEFFNVLKENNSKSSISIIVMRNQEEQEFKVLLKEIR
ncbi:PDZ domain-containing protein [Flammeovirga sp. SJP92]|uniref:PDZ domain-containing protein n=1 Tax=Flammeovirga sp. SJP92 TaxID=1775430 RepID=UPI0007893E46|nr:PDZ domain-containing protein [Flammeovirga sp. SJP92]